MTPTNWYVFILVVIFIVGWFAVGTQYNVRKGHKVLAWLQQGLKLLGEKTTLRWMGSAVVELKLENARDPFQRVEVLAVLEPRDVSLLWWFHHVRGRRDLLILRGNLRRAPRFEFEALDPHGWSTRGIEKQVRFRNWNQQSLPGSPLVAYAAADAPPAANLLAAIGAREVPVLRLAIRRTEPNLEIHWKLEDAQRITAHQLFDTVRRLPEALFAQTK